MEYRTVKESLIKAYEKIGWRGLLAILALILSLGGAQRFGAGYAPVTGYESNTTARTAAGATSISVASVNDFQGNPILASNINTSSTPRMYFNLEPGGSRQELFYCTGVSGLTLTGCVGGLVAQGGSLTPSSTQQETHPAGSKIIMTNTGQFYANELLGVRGNQTKIDVLTFDSFPAVTNTNALPVSNGQFVTKLYADTVGIAGLTAAGASTTMGLQSFTGLSNCSTTGTCFGLNVSSTASYGGGFMSFATSTGQLFWNLPAFLGGSWTFTNALTFATFTGTSTVNNLQITGSPDTDNDATNKSYVDAAASYAMATGTAGTAITPGQTLYISTTGTLFLASANQGAAGNAANSASAFVGISKGTYSVGQTVTYIKAGGVADVMSGLSSGKQYYLSNTAGAIATSPGSYPVRIGIALSGSRLQLITPSFRGRASGTASFAFNGGANAVTVGFVPTRIDFICNNDQGGTGWWMVNSDGTTSTGSVGRDSSTAGNWMVSNSTACKWNEGGGNTASFFVTTSTNGFTMTPNGYAQTRTVYWTATVDDLYFP